MERLQGRIPGLFEEVQGSQRGWNKVNEGGIKKTQGHGGEG